MMAMALPFPAGQAAWRGVSVEGPALPSTSSTPYNDKPATVLSRGEASGSAKSDTTLTCRFIGCGKSFAKTCKLEDHERTHTGERPFQCAEVGCGKSFRRKDHLQRHAKSHMLAVSAPSSTAAVDADDPIALAARPFGCPHTITDGVCGRRFLTRQHLLRHLREYHNSTTSCDEATWTEGEETGAASDVQQPDAPRKRRRARRAGQYACTVDGCMATFTKRKLLRSHINVLHSDKGKPMEGMDEAQAIRMARLPFPCTEQGCDRRFATHAKRTAHIRSRHGSGERARPYVCMHEAHQHETAEEVPRFATWSELQAHQRADHPMACSHCRRTFKGARNLRTHEARCGGNHDAAGLDEEGMEQPLLSLVCGWTAEEQQPCTQVFTSKYNRDMHIRTVHCGERPFPCPHAACTRHFSSKRAALRHGRKCSFQPDHIEASDAVEVESYAADGEDGGTVHQEEAESDDDFYRLEGGAVPEGASDRPKIGKRAAMSEVTAISLASLPKERTIKRRRTRGRVLGCPWGMIVNLQDQSTEQDPSRLLADATAAGTSNALDDCPFRFIRLYDVHRHLKAQHGLTLAQIDLAALYPEQEAAMPSKRTQTGRQAAAHLLASGPDGTECQDDEQTI